MTKIKGQSLRKQANPLAEASHQLKVLSEGLFKDGTLPLFKDRVAHDAAQLVRGRERRREADRAAGVLAGAAA